MLPLESPKGVRSHWPEVVHNDRESYGWNAPKVTLEKPSPEEIDRLDRVLVLIYRLAVYQRTVVVGRMMGHRWSAIGRTVKDRGLGRSGHQELKEAHRRGLEALYCMDEPFWNGAT